MNWIAMLTGVLFFNAAVWAQEVPPAERAPAPDEVTTSVEVPAETDAPVLTDEPPAGAVPVQAETGLRISPTAGQRVVSGIKGDVVGGGWVAAALLNGTANTIVRSMRGEKPDEAA